MPKDVSGMTNKRKRGIWYALFNGVTIYSCWSCNWVIWCLLSCSMSPVQCLLFNLSCSMSPVQCRPSDYILQILVTDAQLEKVGLSLSLIHILEDFRIGSSADRGRPSVAREHLKSPDWYKSNIPCLVNTHCDLILVNSKYYIEFRKLYP